MPWEYSSIYEKHSILATMIYCCISLTIIVPEASHMIGLQAILTVALSVLNITVLCLKSKVSLKKCTGVTYSALYLLSSI